MRALTILVTPLPLPAAAACQTESKSFSCTFEGKLVQLFDWNGALIDNFRPTKKPELRVAEPLETVAYTP